MYIHRLNTIEWIVFMINDNKTLNFLFKSCFWNIIVCFFVWFLIFIKLDCFQYNRNYSILNHENKKNPLIYSSIEWIWNFIVEYTVKNYVFCTFVFFITRTYSIYVNFSILLLFNLFLVHYRKIYNRICNILNMSFEYWILFFKCLSKIKV